MCQNLIYDATRYKEKFDYKSFRFDPSKQTKLICILLYF